MGWRGFFERYLETGALVELGDGFFEPGNHYCCVLTEKGRRNAIAHKCLEFFRRSANRSPAETIPAAYRPPRQP